ncbi:MAG: hypothetical protein DCC68_07340 [Planctomycetota bacterium]|nr:MAG: hypothetical protein DCC68_07340 [Planctomycetota bacterium]
MGTRLVLALGICGAILGCGESKNPKTASDIINGYPVALLFEPDSDALAYGFVAIPSFKVVSTSKQARSEDVAWLAPHLDELWINGERVPKDELNGFFLISAGTRVRVDLSSAELEELAAAGMSRLDETKAWREKVLPALIRSQSSSRS